ncbi:hypothetical protein Tco_0644489 [Tanacetum coccineum]
MPGAIRRTAQEIRTSRSVSSSTFVPTNWAPVASLGTIQARNMLLQLEIHAGSCSIALRTTLCGGKRPYATQATAERTGKLGTISGLRTLRGSEALGKRAIQADVTWEWGVELPPRGMCISAILKYFCFIL